MKAEQTVLANGLIISRVLTGLWQIADLERDGKTLAPNEAAKMMAPYAEAGFNTFDMADHYGSAEIISGVFRKKYAGQTEPKLFTKWVPTPGPVTRNDVRAAVLKAMERLQVRKIDLMQFHAWNYADPRWLDCLYWLNELRGEGYIQHIGLTNFDTAHLRIAVTTGIPIVSNQVCYSLLDQRASGAMAEYCQKHGIKLLAFGTIAGGFLTEKWADQKEPSMEALTTWSQMKYKRYIDAAGGWERFQLLLHVIHAVAKRNNVSLSNVASRYILDQPAVAGVIIGARLGKSEHIQENLRLSSFSLSERDREEIHHALHTHLMPIPGDCGDEYRKPPFLTASGDLSHHIEKMPTPFPTSQGSDGRTKALSGTVWEELAGFSRAVRKGNRILISGTTATHGTHAIGGNDPVAQAHFVIDKIEGALQSLGSKLEEVVRTRIFIRNMSDWEAIARVHGERFREIQPANTMVRADLVGDDYLVEMEAEAMVGENPS